MFLDSVRDWNRRVCLKILVGSEDACAEYCVVPIKNYACLAQLRLILRLEPDLVLRQSREHLSSQQFIGAGRVL